MNKSLIGFLIMTTLGLLSCEKRNDFKISGSSELDLARHGSPQRPSIQPSSAPAPVINHVTSEPSPRPSRSPTVTINSVQPHLAVPEENQRPRPPNVKSGQSNTRTPEQAIAMAEFKMELAKADPETKRELLTRVKTDKELRHKLGLRTSPLTDKQKQARKEFIEKLESSNDEEKAQMKTEVLTNSELRSSLGLE